MKSHVAAVRSLSVSKEVADFKRAAETYIRKAASSPKSANDTLVSLGIYTPKGELTKYYRR